MADMAFISAPAGHGRGEAGGAVTPLLLSPSVNLTEARRIAAAYPPEARCVPRAERETYLTETQQLAWLLRFHPKEAAEVMSAFNAASPQPSRSDRRRPRALPHLDNHHG
ncbi:hypothetical protein [Sphingobium yanoikuyae]|uniref:hypothetical protein n=1 Tax=Sphingobium yanoikuyae TaxID=13690 RepID=UPI0012F7BA5D|nr:hypothetical protein [Sphingobium yanoikuyae]WQE06531.1 hypothetical protein U0025_19870 [Sphingobium yanoikuyae]